MMVYQLTGISCSENTSAICEFQFPLMLLAKSATMSRLENTVLYTHSLEGYTYSSFAQGTDIILKAMHVAEHVQLT